MYCKKCGAAIDDSTKFCSKCGGSVETPPEAIGIPARPGFIPPMKTSKLSKGAKTWCIICLIANFALANAMIALLINSRQSSAEVSPLAISSIVLAYLAVLGFALLLGGKKPGFYIVCVCSAASVITNLMSGSYLPMLLGIANPVITWMLLKDNWSKWEEISRANMMQEITIYTQNGPPEQRSIYYWVHGRKYKIWSIVNSCMFFMLVLPILGIFEAEKAQQATSDDEHNQHIKKVRLYNLITYGAMFAVSIVRGILATLGIIPE